MGDTVHSCSQFCQLPACVEQRRKAIAEAKALAKKHTRMTDKNDLLERMTATELAALIDEVRQAATAQAPMPPPEMFAIVNDRHFEGAGLSLAVHDGTNFVFGDGDCFDRDGDTLDGYTAEFLTWIKLEARLAAAQAVPQWLPIESAPRNSRRVLIAIAGEENKVKEAWWRLPYEGAPVDQCWWSYGSDGTALDKSVHGVGYTHWMPLPAPPITSAAAEVGKEVKP